MTAHEFPIDFDVKTRRLTERNVTVLQFPALFVKPKCQRIAHRIARHFHATMIALAERNVSCAVHNGTGSDMDKAWVVIEAIFISFSRPIILVLPAGRG
jgi:hypothetical protein